MLPWCTPTVLIQATSCPHNHSAKLWSRPIVVFIFHLKHSVCFHAVGLSYGPDLFASDIIYACCPQARPMRQVIHFGVAPGCNFTKHSSIQIRSKITNVVFLSCYLGYTWLQIFCTDHGYPSLRHVQRIMAITQIHYLEFGREKNHYYKYFFIPTINLICSETDPGFPV